MHRRSRARGAVMAEYSLLLTAVAIPAMLGIYLGGTHLVAGYQAVRDNILSMYP